MKAYGKPKGNGYCCEWCDGPYRNWAKRGRKRMRKIARQEGKKQIKDQEKDELQRLI